MMQENLRDEPRRGSDGKHRETQPCVHRLAYPGALHAGDRGERMELEPRRGELGRGLCGAGAMSRP